ncbi:integrin alpha-8-like isoform X1 [Ostrinia furnacalis]|uniref:integrin alpha-8-like isoform X1 n=1 Tax=Ostrinia furnacalis TaxID=93504 RepID=UPI00103DEC2B|nr:integrin alpha-8-like isoform X1 [Ostrinia furnacalis]
MALLFCVLLCACAGALGFNVDIPSRVVYKGNHHSMFGFTVQSHVDGDRKMILVGAPEDQPTYTEGVSRPGAVYRCEPGYRGYPAEGDRSRPLEMCSEMVFDRKRTNNVDTHNHQIDQKSNQWFGATLASTGRNGPIVACAPRYVSFVSHKLNQRDPVGTCYVAKTSDAIKVEEISPCRTTSHGQRKTGVCQAGFSAAVSKDGERLFMGAPGSFYWQGRTITVDITIENFNYFMPTIPQEGQLYSRNVSQIMLIATPEASPKYDDSYMGYSVTVGDFVGHGIQGVAVGVPRGADLKGLVVIYTRDLENFKNITGSQIGAYFGYSLASGDIDGDGTDDIIIGAPMFTRKKSDGYEHGRVYVIYQGRDRTFTRHHSRTGEVSKGRFGLAVTSLGDINLDGFGDVAIGAPYGGENGRGVVYIYLGSKNGISEKHSQAITAEEISPTLTTFGFSLSGGVDLDNNNYTDLAVGAYKSDSIVFLKSRPVVKVMADVKFMGESKTIALTEKRCTLGNGTRVACADVMFCLTYNGINVDQQINFEVTLDLDSRQKTSKRLFMMESRETTYRTHILLTQGQQECRDIKVYVDEEFRDKLTPIEVKMSYELVTQPSGNVVPPVLDQTEGMEPSDSLNIPKNCGADNICIPDLRLAASTPTIKYILGSGDNLNIDVKVENSGEDAFEAAYYLRMPAGVTYAKMERLDKDNADAVPIYCSTSGQDEDGNSTLKCDLGNPMPSGQKVHYRVVLEVDSRVTSLNFFMEANSTNPEQDTQYDNAMPMNIMVDIKAHLSIIGTSDPPELHYNASLYDSYNLQDESKLGPQVIHKYNIKNEGPFTVEEAEIVVMWPYQTLTGENLMYMLVQPQWLGDVRCNIARHVNPENLLVASQYTFLLNKEKEAMMSSDLYSGSQIAGGGGYYGQNIWEVNQQSGGSQHSGGQYGTSQSNRQGGGGGQASDTRYSTSQRGQFGTAQAGGGQDNRGSSTTYNKSWSSDSYNEGLTVEQQEKIRKYLAAAAARPPQYGTSQGQGHRSQGTYGQGLADGGSVVRVKNRTIEFDEHGNVISETETSTEYGSLGHEGEAGSSFNVYANRDHASGGGSHASSSQSGRFGSAGSQGSGNIYSQRGAVYGQGSGQSSGQSQAGFVHGAWATTETVNSDIMNAGSSTYHGSASNTVLEDEDDAIGGFGAAAARNPNNEFRVGFGDVTGAETSGQGQRTGGNYHSGGGTDGRNYQTAGGRSAQSSGSSFQTSSGGGYSYSQSGGQTTYNTYGSSFGSTSQRRESTRRRRQDQADPQLTDILQKCEEKYKCEVLRCTTGRLVKGQEVWLALKSRINASVLNEISKDRAVILSTLTAARVSRLAVLGEQREAEWQKAEAQTVVTPQLEALESGSIPLWVIILAAVIGALLLLLLIFALYKCGFFKRNRPSDHAERQPLNGRDEHL